MREKYGPYLSGGGRGGGGGGGEEEEEEVVVVVDGTSEDRRRQPGVGRGAKQEEARQQRNGTFVYDARARAGEREGREKGGWRDAREEAELVAHDDLLEPVNHLLLDDRALADRVAVAVLRGGILDAAPDGLSALGRREELADGGALPEHTIGVNSAGVCHRSIESVCERNSHAD